MPSSAIAKKSAGKASGKKGKKPSSAPAYGLYVRKILDQIYPGENKGDRATMGISGVGLEALNLLILDVQQRLVDQSTKLARYQKKATLGTKHVHAAATLVMPSDLAKHAMKDASRSVSAYAAHIAAAASKKKK